LNIGCTPSKALLHFSHHLYEHVQNIFAHHGITLDNLVIDVVKIQENKAKAVKGSFGIERLFRKNKVEKYTFGPFFPALSYIFLHRLIASSGKLTGSNVLPLDFVAGGSQSVEVSPWR